MTSTSPFFREVPAIIENEHWKCCYDKYPVSLGHVLVITKRLVKDYFECSIEEKKSLLSTIDEVCEYLKRKYQPDGFNIGMNIGKEGGQTIFHMHLHVIPRYQGDTPNPKGGVRGVIPNKQNYDG
ncbi:MAG: HIT family protein [Flavobacteriaceae bacterium]|nr:HIT family protein [Flavobacteriaceae bacterium]